jgi:hypothetical protein
MFNYSITRAHISGRQTPCSTQGLTNVGVEPGINPGFDILRCGPRIYINNSKNREKYD